MEITLTPELEKLIAEKVNSGIYTCATEVIREALYLLKAGEYTHEQRLKQLNQAIDAGLKDLVEGRTVPADEAYACIKSKILSMKNNHN